MNYFGYDNGLVDNSTGIEIACFNNNIYIYAACVCEGKNTFSLIVGDINKGIGI